MEIQKVHIRAVQSIPQYGCVTASGELADSSNPAHEFHVVGITDGMINGSAPNPIWGDVTVLGPIFNVNWTWNPGAVVYLNGTTLSQTPPGVGFTQKVGWALTAQSLLVKL